MLSSEEKRMQDRLSTWKTTLASIRLEFSSLNGELRFTAFAVVGDVSDSELHLKGHGCDLFIALRGCDPTVVDNPAPQYACSVQLDNVDAGRCLLLEMADRGKGRAQ